MCLPYDNIALDLEEGLCKGNCVSEGCLLHSKGSIRQDNPLDSRSETRTLAIDQNSLNTSTRFSNKKSTHPKHGSYPQKLISI